MIKNLSCATGLERVDEHLTRGPSVETESLCCWFTSENLERKFEPGVSSRSPESCCTTRLGCPGVITEMVVNGESGGGVETGN